MANQFDTEVLRRSLSRGTLMDYAQLPDVQPGPSAGVYFAEAIGNLMEGAGNQFLKSKELDLKFQGQAIQAEIAKDTLDLNTDKFNFDKDKYHIEEAEETLGDVSYEMAGDLLKGGGLFPDTPAGIKAQKINDQRHAKVKPIYDFIEKFNNKTLGMDIVDILNIKEEAGLDADGNQITITGAEMIDRYGSVVSKDARFKSEKANAVVSEYDKYIKNRGYYQLLSDEDNFLKTFGLHSDDPDEMIQAKNVYTQLRGLSPEKGQDIIVKNIVNRKIPDLNEHNVRNRTETLRFLLDDISKSEQTISNLQRIIDSKTSTNAEVNSAKLSQKRISERVTKRRAEIEIVSGSLRPLSGDDSDDKIVDTKIIEEDGKNYKVNLNAKGNIVGKRIEVSKEPFDVKKTIEQERKAKQAKTLSRIPDIKFNQQDIMDVFTTSEDRQKLTKKFNELKANSKDGVVSAYSPEWKIFLDEMEFFDKLKNLRNLRRRQQEGAARGDTIKSRLGQSPDALPIDTSAFEF